MSTHPFAAASRLDGAEHLLDADLLSSLLGRRVRLRRARMKTSGSLVVAWEGVEGSSGASSASAGSAARAEDPSDAGTPNGHPDTESIGWAAILPPAKARNAERRAARHGLPLDEHAAGSAGEGATILSGSLRTDPRLVHPLHSLERRTGGTLPGQVLSYNPMRRCVLQDDRSDRVMRVSATSLEPLARIHEALAAGGVPTLPVRVMDRRARLVRMPRFGIGDLRSVSLPASERESAAEAAGRALAVLHSLEAPPVRTARIGNPVPEALEALACAVPELADRAREIAQRLAARLPEVMPAGAWIHGDFSPDQVLLAPAGDPDGLVRLIDLDRAGGGPAALDLATWVAACDREGLPELRDALIDAYGSSRDVPPLAPWIARAHAAAVMEPIRTFAPDMRERTIRELELAEAALDGVGSALLGRTLRVGEESWEIARAWPADRHGMPLELRAVSGGSEPGPGMAESDSESGPGPELGPEPGPKPEPGVRGARRTEHGDELLAEGEDPRLPALAPAVAAGGRIVSHRPGKRAVVRTAEGHFLKAVRPGKGPALLEAIQRAGAFGEGFDLPTVIRAADDHLVLQGMPGVELHDSAAFDDETWDRAWRATLQAWERTIRATNASGEAVHDAAAEQAVLRTWERRSRAAGLDARRTRAVERAIAGLGRLDPAGARIALIHRDLHDKQVLFADGARPTLLDVDTACLGDAAVDLGNLRAHAAWREVQGLWPAARARTVSAAVEETAQRLGIAADRLDAYDAATRARLTCVYAFRPRWRRTVLSLIGASGAPLHSDRGNRVHHPQEET